MSACVFIMGFGAGATVGLCFIIAATWYDELRGKSDE